MAANNPAFPVQLFYPAAYIGDLTAVNVKLLTTGGVTRPAPNGGLQQLSSGHQSVVVPTTINWLVYAGGPGPNFPSFNNAVSFNLALNNQGAAAILDKIDMVYVNNTGGTLDVTIYFPDTGMFITAEGGTSGYYPVMTNILQCYAYSGTVGSGQDVDTGQTQILFCNFAVPGFVTANEARPFEASFRGPNINAVGQIVQTLGLPDAKYKIFGISVEMISGNALAAGPVFVRTCFLNSDGTFGFTQELFTSAVQGLAAAAGAVTFNTFRDWNLTANPTVINTGTILFPFQCLTLVNLNNVNFSINLIASQA